MSWWSWWSKPFFIKSWFDPPYQPFQNWSAICWISLSELQFWGRQQWLIDGATSAFYWKRRWKQMWRHLSIAVAALKTVVQRVRSNRWRFNFERARRGGQINFLWKMLMIITITKASILITCPFPRGLLLTCPISPPPIHEDEFKAIWNVKMDMFEIYLKMDKRNKIL